MGSAERYSVTGFFELHQGAGCQEHESRYGLRPDHSQGRGPCRREKGRLPPKREDVMKSAHSFIANIVKCPTRKDLLELLGGVYYEKGF